MKTLRHWAGLNLPTKVDARATVLLVIDFQREYFDGKLPIPEGQHALAAAKELVKAADVAGMPVIHVHHVAANPAAPLFAVGSLGAEPVADLQPAAHHDRVVKHLPSAFAGTKLLTLLQEKACKNVIVCGLMTHNCVDTTVRDAMHLGFSPIVAADACATRDLPGAAGGAAVSARMLHEAVLAGLADRIADVMPVAQLITLVKGGSQV